MGNNIMDVHPIVLQGKFIRLEPLNEAHVPDLSIAGRDKSIWQYMLYGPVIDLPRMRSWVEDMLNRQKRGTDLPFAVILKESGKAIGATRYIDIRPSDRGVEIGGTWFAIEYQHTVVNTESKYLLLKHAFETLGCIRVQFKTDLRNERSQQAIERLGAVKEGVFRNHMVLLDGTIRHSVYYSIIDAEWPAIKINLEQKINNWQMHRANR
jgi:RimJ/RimL family protein N-acetyltransferase